MRFRVPLLLLVCLASTLFGYMDSYSLYFRRALSPMHTSSCFKSLSSTKSSSPVLVKSASKSHQQLSPNSQNSLTTSTGATDLTIFGIMLCGAISRTVAALAVHPLHALKVNLQLQGQQGSSTNSPALSSVTPSLVKPKVLSLLSRTTLTRGLAAQLLFTLPHGALSFGVTEITKKWLQNMTSTSKTLQGRRGLDPALDLLSASLASIVCSVISIPQMLLTDRIMVGLYPSLRYGLLDILRIQGVMGLYQGWVPAMLLKLPSSALTWMFFQQLRKLYPMETSGQAKLALASLSAAASCALMNPVDTIKTRLIMQRRRLDPGSTDSNDIATYAGIIDCFQKVFPPVIDLGLILPSFLPSFLPLFLFLSSSPLASSLRAI